jgi:RimJ/RimL family protein N-acetyltransferase
MDPDPWTPPKPLPGPVQTERLFIRPYQKGDGPALFKAIDESRESILPEMVWAFTDHQDIDDTVYYVESQRRAMEKESCRDFTMGIFDRNSGEIVGGTGLHRIRPEFREVEVGYWITGKREGQGLATEATGALITAAFTPHSSGGWGFRRLLIFNAVHNPASRRVCEKLGLRLEMRLKQERYFGPPGANSGYIDMLGFAVLSDEWDASTNRARPGIDRFFRDFRG